MYCTLCCSPNSHHGARVGWPPRCPQGPPGPRGAATTFLRRARPSSGAPVAGNATARRAAEPALEHVRARHELHEAIPASAAARAWRAELPGTLCGRARLVDPQKMVIIPW